MSAAGDQGRVSFVGAGDDQERLLDQAIAVVKEQGFYMRRAIDSDNVREALKHSSNLICELRTSLLSPKNYYELYMLVFQEMQNLYTFFGDKSRHGRKMQDLYESVQHAGNILPRLYLLATVGASYIKSKEGGSKEILKDMHELCKGVQHPMRGLFLRYYLSQMVKDKLPDTGSEYEGEGGNIDDAFDFIFNNFSESNRLWVRMQHQGPSRDKQKRDKERHELRVLVGANLVRLSQLEGITADYYATTALPRILEHVVGVKDFMSQQYLFESMIQVFPDEFHLRTLEQTLAAYTKAQPGVDMKVIMVALMSRLANYLSQSPDTTTNVDVFSLLRAHLQQVLERSLEPQGGDGGMNNLSLNDLTAPLEVQASFISFTLSLYPNQLHYIDIILGSTAEILRKYFARVGDPSGGLKKLSGPCADKVQDLLSETIKMLSPRVLELEHYGTLLGFLTFQTRKQVALSIVASMVEDNRAISSVEAVSVLFGFIAPVIKDEDDTPNDEGNNKEAFQSEQHQVCKLVHLIRAEDIDTEFMILSEMRKFFGQGGPLRMAHTLQPTCFAALGLVAKIRERDRRRTDGEDDGTAPTVTVKKVFQFVHKTITAMVPVAPDVALQLWLIAAASADQVDLEPICNEFVTQGLIVFEDEISDSTRQFQGIFNLVGTLTRLTCLDTENFDTLSTKVAQHAARLLKKPMQCRAVAVCSNLFWCEARRDGKRVLECLQKCLKITDAVVQSDAKQVVLWVEMLDKYVYYFSVGCEEVTIKFVQSLVNLSLEHISFAESDGSAGREAKNAKSHLEKTVARLRGLQQSPDAEVAARFAELDLSAVK